ncbi:MAG: PPOX class F420-dependent oxidoreductase [Candidatus Dormibacteraceae bacterium]
MPMVDEQGIVRESHRDILEARGLAYIATIGPKQSPQVSPTWYLWDGEKQQLLISLTTNRQKYHNLKREPRLAICLMDPENPYRYIEMRGSVESIEADENHRLINALAKKYLGKDEFPEYVQGEVRVVVRIASERVICFELG